MLSDKLCQPINGTTKLNRATSPLLRVVDLEKNEGIFMPSQGKKLENKFLSNIKNIQRLHLEIRRIIYSAPSGVLFYRRKYE